MWWGYDGDNDHSYNYRHTVDVGGHLTLNSHCVYVCVCALILIVCTVMRHTMRVLGVEGCCCSYLVC